MPPRRPERVGDVGDGLRLFLCARCGREVRVCVPCDRGQIYCAGDCRAIRRRESVRRAGATYQGSPKGARKHAARQGQLRLAKFSGQKVTHHGFTRDPARVMVASSPVAEHAAIMSFDDVRHELVRQTGARVPERQVEEPTPSSRRPAFAICS